RAAALRPPAPPTQRPTITADPEPAPKRKWGWPVAIISILVLIALLATAFFVVRSKVMQSYYVASSNGDVVIMKGAPGRVMFLSLNTPSQKVCVSDLNTSEPGVTFQNADANCQAMRVEDLTGIGRNTVESNGIKNLSQSDAQDRVRDLKFLPICEQAPAPEPSTPPTGSGEPKPDVSKTHEEPKPSEPTSTTASLPPLDTTGPDGNRICRGN
ncbi:MAG: serine/threonine protein phosphatase, partial [Gordonia sp. (in: high G+C Gram-positive bacteria)]